ncbi:MAG: NAD(P)H-dependent oxidoreductase subunit E [Thermoanaerobaculia bacterium]|jgi:NADH-quinone oxidoreductase E subunit
MAHLQPDSPYAAERYADTAKTVEFSPEAKAKFDALLERYPTKEAALLPSLHLAQEEFGWVSPEVMMYLSGLLEIEPAKVFGVVTFYNMYNQKPVGKHHVQVCTNLSCMIRNAYDIYDRCLEKLGLHPGETTKDGRITVTEVECLGSCGTAPVVQINNDYHENASVESIDKLLDTLK